MKGPTERFSDRVQNYVRYRPDYPQALIDKLIDESAIGPGSIVADVGAGTGIFGRQLIDANLRVISVEPNLEMRAAAEEALAGQPNFTSVDGQAEATTLPDAGVDLVTAAQSFHWFDYDDARREFARILRPDGCVALIWNQRDMATGFQQGYERLLDSFAPEYAVVNHTNLSVDRIAGFFSTGSYRSFAFAHEQRLDHDAFLGRMRSSSYIPSKWTPELRDAAEQLFLDHSTDGEISFAYEAWLHMGSMSGG